MAAAAGEGFTTATAVADLLVELGVAFRTAHKVVGRIVAAAEAGGHELDALPDDLIKRLLAGSDDADARALVTKDGIGDLIRGAASVPGALARFDVIGGTAPARVRAELAAASKRLGTA
jgi:argininosuccinate lyase